MIVDKLIKRITDGIARRYRWYFLYPKARQSYQAINILDSIQSIKYIIDNDCSVSRFGDGELSMFFGEGIGFQDVDKKLIECLQHVLVANDAPNHFVGLPYHFKDVSGLIVSSREFWGDLIYRHGDQWLKYLSTKRMYIDTQISRFYKPYNNVRRSSKQLEMLKRIWQDRDIVIVEGCKSRTGVGNDLYDNAKSLQRILGYATNAFSHYEDMLKAITSYVNPEDGKLILLSYGPTATILAYDLAKLGYQAIDIGHLDIEYEWYLLAKDGKAIKDKVAIKGKYTNESKAGDMVDDCIDEMYLSQIICDITKY